jgi:tRNA G18 (ribose-2'-O)-methylase SpoU
MKDISEFPERLTSWIYNVEDRFKDKTKEEIQENLRRTAHPFAIMMANIQGDFNIGSLFRSANAFNAKEFFYFGKKRIDRRSLCGVHHYSEIQFLPEWEQVVALKERYTFVVLENTNRTHMLHQFDWKTPKDPLVICGEEGCGIPQELLNLADVVLEIPMFGSIRSFNTAVAGSIAMYDLIAKKYS